jgi:hypothetical protein
MVPAYTIAGIEPSVALDRDAAVSGIINGDLVIRSGVKALVTGIIQGAIYVEPDGVLYFHGILKGDLDVKGAACVAGILGKINAADDATVCIEPNTIRKA